MPKEMGRGEERRNPLAFSSLWTIFMHADAVDKWLMALGFSGAIMSGIATPMVLFITSNMVNNLGTGPSLSPRFMDQVNKVRSPLLLP